MFIRQYALFGGGIGALDLAACLDPAQARAGDDWDELVDFRDEFERVL
jgi:hypothetical protein